MLVDLRIEWLALALGFFEGLLLLLLLFMLGCLILERVLVEHLIFTLASVEAICEAVVILELLKD